MKFVLNWLNIENMSFQSVLPEFQVAALFLNFCCFYVLLLDGIFNSKGMQDIYYINFCSLLNNNFPITKLFFLPLITKLMTLVLIISFQNTYEVEPSLNHYINKLFGHWLAITYIYITNIRQTLISHLYYNNNYNYNYNNKIEQVKAKIRTVSLSLLFFFYARNSLMTSFDLLVTGGSTHRKKSHTSCIHKIIINLEESTRSVSNFFL